MFNSFLEKEVKSSKFNGFLGASRPTLVDVLDAKNSSSPIVSKA